MSSQFEILADINMQIAVIDGEFLASIQYMHKWTEMLSAFNIELDKLDSIKDDRKTSIVNLQSLQQKMDNHIAISQNPIKELQLTLAQVEKDKDELLKNLESAKTIIIEQQAEIETLSIGLETEKLTASKLEKTLSEVEVELGILTAKKQNNNEGDALKKLYAKCLEENQSLRTQLQNLNSNKDSEYHLAKIESMAENNENLQRTNHSLATRLENLQTENREMQQKVILLESTNKQMETLLRKRADTINDSKKPAAVPGSGPFNTTYNYEKAVADMMATYKL